MTTPMTQAAGGKPVIRVFIAGSFGRTDIACVAVADDGEELASHISSSETWAKHDLGVTSDRKHDLYRAKYPDGFEVRWVDRWQDDPFLVEQANKNAALQKAGVSGG